MKNETELGIQRFKCIPT